MSLLLTILAALLAALANLATKRNLDQIGSPRGYLVIYFFLSFLSSFLINPSIFQTEISFTMLAIGSVAGIFAFLLMISLTQALKYGSPGITFAFQSAGSVLPSVLLFFLFGPLLGFIMTPFLIVGLLCVLIGLFWSAKPELWTNLLKKFQSFSQNKPSTMHELQTTETEEKINPSHSLKKWAFYAIASFFIQGITFSIFHWRSLLVEHPPSTHPLLSISCKSGQELWFMPSFFLVATLLNALFFFLSEKRLFRRTEYFYGTISGLLNAGSTYLLLLATYIASPIQKAIMFPLFAISVIIFCGIWGQKLYQEHINWIALAICMLGVLLCAL